MEKRKPSYDLAAIKAAIGSLSTLSMTVSAYRDAINLGFDDVGIVEIVNSVERPMFVKSITTYGDHRVWQDVYYVTFENYVIYLKFQADRVTEFRIISFKER